mgnify:CR=1 FL=1
MNQYSNNMGPDLDGTLRSDLSDVPMATKPQRAKLVVEQPPVVR